MFIHIRYVYNIYIYTVYGLFIPGSAQHRCGSPWFPFNSRMDPQDRHEWHWRWTQCGNSTSLWAGASWIQWISMVPIWQLQLCFCLCMFMFIHMLMLFGMIMSIHKNWGWVETCWDNWAGMKLQFPGLALKLPALDCLGLKRTFQELVVEI